MKLDIMDFKKNIAKNFLILWRKIIVRMFNHFLMIDIKRKVIFNEIIIKFIK